MIGLRLALAAAFVVPPTAAARQPVAPTAAPATDHHPWLVDWGAHYCTLVSNSDPGRPFSTAILVVPGSLSSEIILVPAAGTAPPRGIDRLVLMPSGRSLDVTSRDERRGRLPVLAIYGLDYGFRDLLAEAAELRLQSGDSVRASILLNGVRAAVAAHRECTADVSREWRVDEAALAALRQRPDSTNMLGFRPEDYPTRALASRTQGRVSMRITVSAEGRAADCTVVESSGSSEIDTRSCRVAMERGRFHPGLDAAGQPVSIPVIFTVTWMIPAP
jgi:TonB family protein